MEFDVRVRSDDGSLKDEHKLSQWGDIFIRCAERAGRSLNIHETMRGSIEKAGFVDVHQKKSRVPLGPWPKDKQLKEVGQLEYAHWKAALEGWAMWLLTHFGEPEPWTKEEVHVFLAAVRLEMKNSRLHGYNWMYVSFSIGLLKYLLLTLLSNRVWARKPTEEELKIKKEIH